ncbi:SCO6745 family protein [Actinomadura sp. ATCC 39365]
MDQQLTRTARRAWRRLEPVHGMIYFVPEATTRYAALGLTGMSGYFTSRSAPLGPAPADLVIATFYNFNPDLVRRSLPWDRVTPAQVLQARLEAAAEALRRAAVHELPDLVPVLTLARRAAEAACDHPQGRPLFAAHAALPWPDDPLLQLWHAQTLLREFRGDGHVATLLAEGITGLEALVLHAASGEVAKPFLTMSRAWPPDQWAHAETALRTRGLLTPGNDLTPEGKSLRHHLETRTDTLAMPAYGALGEPDCERLADLARPFGRRIVDSGLLKLT